MSILSTENRERFIVLRDRGLSLDEIADIIDVEKEKLERWDAALIQQPQIDIQKELKRERIRSNI